MSRSIGTQTLSETTSTIISSHKLPDYCTILLLRSPSTNADNIYIKIDDYTASSNDITLRPGEFISFDISDALKLMASMGVIPSKEDFFKVVSYVASANTPTLEIDSFGIPFPAVSNGF